VIFFFFFIIFKKLKPIYPYSDNGVETSKMTTTEQMMITEPIVDEKPKEETKKEVKIKTKPSSTKVEYDKLKKEKEDLEQEMQDLLLQMEKLKADNDANVRYQEQQQQELEKLSEELDKERDMRLNLEEELKQQVWEHFKWVKQGQSKEVKAKKVDDDDGNKCFARTYNGNQGGRCTRSSHPASRWGYCLQHQKQWQDDCRLTNGDVRVSGKGSMPHRRALERNIFGKDKPLTIEEGYDMGDWLKECGICKD